MVQAVQGILLECDVATKEFLLHKDSTAASAKEKCILYEVDDTRVFVTTKKWADVRRHLKARPAYAMLTPPSTTHRSFTTATHTTATRPETTNMGPPAPRSPTALLRRFSDIQAQRAAAYSQFDAGFRRYLGTAHEASYRTLLAETTVRFQQLSQGVREVEAALRDARHDDLASLLRRVQEQEREKLQSTLALQALRAARVHERLGWDDGADEGVGAEAPVCAHAGAHAGAHADGHACSPPAAPTKAEYEAALNEAIRSLQSTVTTINELLEEVAAAAEASDDDEGDAGVAA